jgi:hypothetical protein
VELLAYCRIRGPLGPPRWDSDAAYSSWHEYQPWWLRDPGQKEEAKAVAGRGTGGLPG